MTFDQSLWCKSRSIILNENADSILKQTILMLGGFRTTMSYLGSVGNIMEGSGLKAVMELVYAGNAVEHILNGKAYARGVRAHYLVDGALNAIVLEHIYGTTIFSENELDANDTPDDLVEALEFCDAILREELGDQDVCQQNIFENIQTKIEAEKNVLSQFLTGKLWIQYMVMIDLLKTFIRSQRTGDFQLYLKCLQEMLPYLAAAISTTSNQCRSIFRICWI